MSFLEQFKLDRIPFYVNQTSQYFRCKHIKSSKEYCLKRMSLNFNSAVGVQDEFTMQVRCGRFANVLQALKREYYKVEDKYFSEEYVVFLQEAFQENLMVWLKRNPSNSAKAAQALIQQILPTLARMEEQEIFHRGLGLEAVFVVQEQPLRLKLGEFNRSKLNLSMSATASIPLDYSLIKRGSKQLDFYAPSALLYDPELFANPKVINTDKSQVYMFGILVLDCLLCGKLNVFEKISVSKILEYHQKQLEQSKIIQKILGMALKEKKTERPNFVELCDAALANSSSTQREEIIVVVESGQGSKPINPPESVQSPPRHTTTQQTKRFLQGASEPSDVSSSHSKPQSSLGLGVRVTVSQVPTQRNTSCLPNELQSSPSSLPEFPEVTPVSPPILLKRFQPKQVQIDKSIFIGNRRDAVYGETHKMEAISLEVYDLNNKPEEILATLQKIQSLKVPGTTEIEGYELSKYLLTFYLQKKGMTLARYMSSGNKKEQTLLELALGLVHLWRGIVGSGVCPSAIEPEMVSVDAEDPSNPTISCLFLLQDLFTPNSSYLALDNPRTVHSLTYSVGVILLKLFFGDIAERGIDLEITKPPRKYNCQNDLLKILAGMTYKEQRRMTLEEVAEKLLVIQREASKVLQAPKTLGPIHVRAPVKTPGKPPKQVIRSPNPFELEGRKVAMAHFTGKYSGYNSLAS